ncbi:hypothetical protein [Methanobrevibacter sp.]|uniref:hypothetical protein n=1 Tax=Methanobrevibacter sp. TaxID=66852 RepID=UPI003866ACF1
MKLKHFLIIGLAIAIVAVAPLSAVDDDDVSILTALDITPFNEDTNVTIDGINFNVPKGYGEQKDLTKDDDKYNLGSEEITLSNHQYMNKDGDLLNLQVIFIKDKNYTMDSLTPDDGAVKKTINGKDGFYSEQDGIAMFMYAQDGKSVQVTGKADVVSKVIV